MSTINWDSCPSCGSQMMTNGFCSNCYFRINPASNVTVTTHDNYVTGIQQTVYEKAQSDDEGNPLMRMVELENTMNVVKGLISEGYKVIITPTKITLDELSMDFYEVEYDRVGGLIKE